MYAERRYRVVAGGVLAPLDPARRCRTLRGEPFQPAGAPAFSPYETGRGVEFRLTDSTPTFDAGHPDVLLYDGTGPTAQVVGIEYTVGNGVAGNPAPEGFAGPNDVWTDVGSGYWRLRVWILRPFQNQPNVFADSHPCLGAGGAIYDETAPCYTATHPHPLEVLVSNDDGVGAPGIDTVVEALRVVPNVHVTVSAPATNQSGAGSKFTDGPVSASDAETASGYPAWSVEGFPVDAVRYALRTRHVNPDLVVSGTEQRSEHRLGRSRSPARSAPRVRARRTSSRRSRSPRVSAAPRTSRPASRRCSRGCTTS